MIDSVVPYLAWAAVALAITLPMLSILSKIACYMFSQLQHDAHCDAEEWLGIGPVSENVRTHGEGL